MGKDKIMEVYYIPFEDQYIVYRPLKKLAFIGNRAMVDYINGRHPKKKENSQNQEIESFLDSVNFWQPDSPLPPEEPSSSYAPTMAVLLMTNACNLRCTYCYARGGERADLWMSLPLAQKAIDLAHENARLIGEESFALAFHGGGEPTLNWRVLSSAVNHAREKSLSPHISMSSNGMWEPDQLDFILDHFDELSLSFDGNEIMQNGQRPTAQGQGSFNQVIKSIHAMDGNGIEYGIRLTVTEPYFHHLAESIKFICQETQCQLIQVEPSFSPTRGEYLDPNQQQADRFIRAFMESFYIASTYGRTIFYSGARPWTLIHSFCRASAEALIVTPEGDLVNCFEIHDRGHPLFHQFKIGTLTPEKIIVDHKKIEGLIQAEKRRKKECKHCFCFWHCGGDCASKCLASAGHTDGRCYVNRTITRELLANYIANGNGISYSQPI